MTNGRGDVPVRTIATVIGMVLVTGGAVWLITQIQQVLVWLLVAMFFAIVLSPVADFLQRRARMPRPLAVLAALLAVFAVVAGIVTVLVRPFISQAQRFIDQLPRYVQQVQTGEGFLGGLMRRFDVMQRIQQNQDRITEAIQQLGDPALGIVLSAGTVVVGIVVVLVLTFLLVLDGPRLVDTAIRLFPEQHRERVRRVMDDAGRAVTGYVGGQLLIATLCGAVTYVVLTILGVPFRNVIALFVGLVDLIPVVGATIGGVVAVGVSFLHSITAGIVMIVFILVYQQIENHLLQPFIQSRTVHMNALAVLVSVLIGVELLGILGALLAIPAAGIIQVVVRDLWSHRRGRRVGRAVAAGEPDAADGAAPRAGALGKDPEDDVRHQPGKEAGEDGSARDGPRAMGVEAEPSPEVGGQGRPRTPGDERGDLEAEEGQERHGRPHDPRDVPQ